MRIHLAILQFPINFLSFLSSSGRGLLKENRIIKFRIDLFIPFQLNVWKKSTFDTPFYVTWEFVGVLGKSSFYTRWVLQNLR